MRPRRRAITAGGLLIALVLVVTAANLVILISTRSAVYHAINNLQPQPVALILGAKVYNNGTLSPILAARMDAGIRLYHTGRVQRLLLSGDNSRPHHAEVTAMKNYALSRGVPDDNIMTDGAGYDTYDSCYRAMAVFGLRQAIVVTQNYHISRAVYLCRDQGIKADGYGLPDWSLYPDVMPWYTGREMLARVKAVWEATFDPRPTSLAQ